VIILFLCYALALIAAYRVASRLAPASLPLTAALTIFLWLVNLILPATYVGMINLLRPEAMLAAGALLWGAQIVLAGRIQRLPQSAMGGDTRAWLLLRRAGYALCGVMFLASCLVILPTLREYGTILDIDAAWHYLPSVISMVQASTLNSYTMLLPYFPLSFETLLTWELTFTRSYLLTPLFHQALAAMCLLFAAQIVQTLLRMRRAHLRDFATQITLFVLIGSSIFLGLAHSIGKNDLMLAAFTLAAVYFLLRAWEGEADGRLLVLAGIACGVMVTTKLTSALWVGGLALGHLAYIAWRRGGLGMILGSALRVGLPALIIGLPWALRIALQPPTTTSFEQLNALGLESTLLRNAGAPAFVDATLARLPELALIGVGVIVLLTPRNPRLLRILGAGLLLAGLVVQAFGERPETNLAIFLTIVVVSMALLIHALRQREASPARPLLLGVLLVSMATFVFLPYSAWIYSAPYLIDLTYQHVMYRYVPGSYPLFIALTVASLFLLLTSPVGAREGAAARPAAARHAWGGIAIAGVLLAAAAQYATLSVDGMIARYANFNQHHADATPIYRWVYDHVRDARIYSINAPPLLLYGRDLSNRVLYATERHSGYYGDQVYRWDEIARLIDAEQLDYIVVSFNYPELMQAALAPTPEVLAEIAQMRASLRTVFEDAHISVFATQHAGEVSTLP
jgi:hypothetical protein